MISLLLRSSSKRLPKLDWEAFLSLQSNVTEFKAQHASGHRNEDDLSTWQTIELMAQATKSYSGSPESLEMIQEMLARVHALPLSGP